MSGDVIEMAASQEFPSSSGLHFLESSVAMLSYLDLWPRRVFHSQVLNTLWRGYIRLMVLLIATVGFLCLVNLFFTYDEVIVFAEALLFIILVGTVTFQWLLMKTKRRQLKKMFELFKHTYQQGRNMLGAEPFEQIWKSNYRKVKAFQWVWSFVVFGIFFQWAVLYLLIPIITSQFVTVVEISTNGTANTGDEEEDFVYRFTFQAWYPYNKYISPYYEVTIGVEAYLMLFLLYVMNTLDFFCNSFMIYLKAHLETLILALRCLPDDHGVDWPTTQQQYEQQLFQSIFSHGAPYVQQLQMPSQLDKGQRLSILQCIRHHKILLELFDMFCRVMTCAMMMNAFKSLGCICLFAFIPMLLPEGDPNVVNMFEIAMFYVLQFFLYAWQAENVTNMSTKLKDAIYESAWVESRQEYRLMVLVLMIRCNKNMIIPCGPFFKMSLQTALELSQFSFSLYACMSQMKMREHHEM